MSADSSLDKSFTEVAAINAMVGNDANSPWPQLLRQAKILLSEAQELVDACEAQDEYKARDGAGDVAFVLAGFEHMSGAPLNADLVEIIASNLTKFDTTEYDAKLTAQQYAAKGIATRCEIRQVPAELQHKFGEIKTTHVFVTYVDGEQTIGTQVVPDGKWLKSHRFAEPSFRDLGYPMGELPASLVGLVN